MALALDVVTTGGAQALGLEDCCGDLLLVAAETLAEAVA
jgi:hypothetical protein